MSQQHRIVTGVVALALGTAAVLGASGVASATVGRGGPAVYDPVEQCANWSGTVQYFPALTKTPQQVTAVVNLTLSDCTLDGLPATDTGSAFGTLTGTAANNRVTLNEGSLAISWPQDEGLDPTIASSELDGKAGAYSIGGTVTNGAFYSDAVGGSYAVTAHTKADGGTTQDISGTQPFYAAEIDS